MTKETSKKDENMNVEPIHPALWDSLSEEDRKAQEQGYQNWKNNKEFSGSKTEVK